MSPTGSAVGSRVVCSSCVGMCVGVSSRNLFTRLIWGFLGKGWGARGPRQSTGRKRAGARKVFDSRGVKLKALSDVSPKKRTPCRSSMDNYDSEAQNRLDGFRNSVFPESIRFIQPRYIEPLGQILSSLIGRNNDQVYIQRI